MTMLWVGTSPNALEAVPLDPSKLVAVHVPVNSSSAGRSQDPNATMHDERMTRKVKISLKWSYPDAATTSWILRHFCAPNHVYLRYLDAESNRWEVRYFYSGTPDNPMKWFDTSRGTRYEYVSFDLIEI